MTQEKQLLLKDLSARLLYGVKVLDNSHKDYGASILINIGIDGSILVDNEINDIQYYPIVDDIKPYLRSLSSMTDEEKKELEYIFYENDSPCWCFEDGCLSFSGGNDFLCPEYVEIYIDFCNQHYLDYRGLIEEGLALEAPKDMYK